MTTKKQRAWTPEQLAVIDRWCKAYPQGAGIDLKRAQHEDSQAWQQLINAGRNKGSIYGKATYQRMHKFKDVPYNRSAPKPYERQADGLYHCELCEFKADKVMKMAAHTRLEHPGKSQRTHPAKPKARITPHRRTAVEVSQVNGKFVTVNVPTNMVNQFVIVSPDGTVRLAKLIKHCPECLEPLMPLNVARNI